MSEPHDPTPTPRNVSMDSAIPPPTPHTVVSPDWPSSIATSSEDDWGHVPPFYEIEKMSRKELRRRIHHLIELLRRVGRGEANPKGGMQLIIIAAQYLTDELARRNQSRQTCTIIIMTLAITAMTLAIMVQTIWPGWIQSAAQSLLIHASQAIDRLRAN